MELSFITTCDSKRNLQKTRVAHTDLYFDCGVELAQSQQQQRPPAAHKQDTGTHSVLPHARTYAQCGGKQNAGKTRLRAEALPGPGHCVLKEERLILPLEPVMRKTLRTLGPKTDPEAASEVLECA